jgi:hypothetical protein
LTPRQSLPAAYREAERIRGNGNPTVVVPRQVQSAHHAADGRWQLKQAERQQNRWALAADPRDTPGEFCTALARFGPDYHISVSLIGRFA